MADFWLKSTVETRRTKREKTRNDHQATKQLESQFLTKGHAQMKAAKRAESKNGDEKKKRPKKKKNKTRNQVQDRFPSLRTRYKTANFFFLFVSFVLFVQKATKTNRCVRALVD
jgi:hypothetical protein